MPVTHPRRWTFLRATEKLVDKLKRAVTQQLAAVHDLAVGSAVTTDLQLLRDRASRFYAFLLWLHIPVIAAIAYTNHIMVWRVTAIMAIAAAASTVVVALRGGALISRLTIAASLTAAAALMVYAGSGPWQIDWHMYFFVVFGLLLIYVDWRPIVLAAALTLGHNLLLDLLLPSAVFPQPGIGRVALHAGIVLVDCLVLFWTASLMLRLFLESAASLKAAQTAAAEARRLESYAKHGSDLIMQAVNLGLLLCDREYRVQPQYSAELEKIFETKDLAGCNLLELLETLLSPRLFNTTRDFIALLFDASRKERTVLRVNPLAEVECSFWDSTGHSFVSKVLDFSFRRIVEDGEVKLLFVAVNDVTERVNLERQVRDAEQKKERQVELMLSILPMTPAVLAEFTAVAREQISAMEKGVRPQDFADLGPSHRNSLDARLDTIIRRAHNVKGNAALIGFEYFRKRAESFELKLAELRSRATLGGDDYLTVVSEQSNLRADIAELEKLRDKFASAPLKSDPWSRNAGAPDEAVVAIDEFATTIAAKLGKEVRVDAAGFDTRYLSSAQRRAVKDALIQLTLNSLTHGIELPHIRKGTGKDPRATLTIRRCDRPGEFAFVFADDGRGFDVDLIRSRAIERQLITPDESWADDETIAPLIFEAGFSTASKPTSEAGQGMGLNIVKQRIVEECGGDIVVRSVPGKSCEFELSFPAAELALVVNNL